MAVIYCDEAGNSGQNLFDPAQPIFVLASTDLGASEADELLSRVRSQQGGEPKFKTLKKTSDGVRRLATLLTDPRLNKSRVVVTAFHKKFMVVTKMVDLIAETLFHDIGEDLYKRGANIAMSNMLYCCMPAFCGVENTDRFLHSFVEMMRFRTEEKIAEFYKAGATMSAACADDDFRNELFLFTERRLFQSWFDGVGELALDPAIPALFQHIATWGVRKSDRFRVIHDRSKPVLASQQQFEEMMALSNEPAMMLGYDRRKFKFPLQAISLEQGDSTEYPSLQIADLCAGAMAHLLKCQHAGHTDDLADLARANCVEWAVDAVMPTANVSPQDLGTDSEDGVNPVDPIVAYQRRRRS